MHLPQPIQSRHQPVREFHGSWYKKGLLRGALSCTSRQQAASLFTGGYPQTPRSRPISPRVMPSDTASARPLMRSFSLLLYGGYSRAHNRDEVLPASQKRGRWEQKLPKMLLPSQKMGRWEHAGDAALGRRLDTPPLPAPSAKTVQADPRSRGL